MPDAEEIIIILGLRSGGTERRRFENILWKRFSPFIYWGCNKYGLPTDEVRLAYDDTICSVIINIVAGRYDGNTNALLKTYAETIFRNKCMDRVKKTSKHSTTPNSGKLHLNNPQPLKNSLSETLPTDVKNVVEEIIQSEEQSKIKRSLEKVGEGCREILLLFASGYKDKEIAQMMNYNSSDVVKQSRYRCLERLSQHYLYLHQHE